MSKTLQALLTDIKERYADNNILSENISDQNRNNLQMLESLLNQEPQVQDGTSFTDLINQIMLNNTLEEANQLLWLASQQGFVKAVEFLVSKGADVNSKYENPPSVRRRGSASQKTALHLAATAGKFEVVQFLVSNGADVNAKDENQDTPLHLAATAGKLEVVQFLVSKGANIDAKNIDSKTSLHFATEYSTYSVVELLVSKGADVNAKDEYQDTPLHLAVKRLIDQINLANRNGNEVQQTVPSEFYNIIEFLLTNGAGIQARNSEGKTVLHLAAECKEVSVINIFLEKEIISTTVINQQDDSHNTPLCLAVSKGISFNAVIQALLNKGADLYIENSCSRHARSYIENNEQLKAYFCQYLQTNNDNVSQNSLKKEGISQQSVSSDSEKVVSTFEEVNQIIIPQPINDVSQITTPQVSQDVQRHPVTGAVVGGVIGVAVFIAIKMIVTSMALALVLASSIFPLLGIALCCAIIGGVAGYNCKSSKNITCNTDLDTQEHRSLLNTPLINENSENLSNKKNQADKQFEQSQDTQDQDLDTNDLKIT